MRNLLSSSESEVNFSDVRAAITTREAAKYLGLSSSTLNKWRCHGGGPEFLKLGRAVRYRFEDLDAFVAVRRLNSTSSY